MRGRSAGPLGGRGAGSRRLQFKQPASELPDETVFATITASKMVGFDAVNLSAWASDKASSPPPANAPSSACPFVVLAR